jgi:hypothetical protein
VVRTTSAEGLSGNDMNLMNEQMLDTFLENILSITSDDITVQLKR